MLRHTKNFGSTRFGIEGGSMTMDHWSQRITLGSMAALATMTIVETVTSIIGKRDHAHVNVVGPDDFDRVVVYFPALATDAIVSSGDFLHLFGRDRVLLVDYPRSGYDPEATFSLVASMLRDCRGKKLLIYAVSMGSSVALDFRRYMQAHPELGEWFPAVKFIFQSPVITAADVKIGFRMVSLLGFIFRGGLLSKHTVKQVLDSLIAVSKVGSLRKTKFEEKVLQLQSALTVISVRLLASEMRAVHFGRHGRPGEFASDTAVILISDWEEIVVPSAPSRLIKAFGQTEIFDKVSIGHADIKLAVSSGIFELALARLI